MTLATIQNSFSGGEISPSLYGRTDLAKTHHGASTMRNAFVNYRGGASSRAGTAYVGMCKQSGSSAPPRDIPFQFSQSQGYALEFGDTYMRIKSNGAYVTETGKNITGISKASLGVITCVGHGYSAGDWVYISGVAGMTNFNGLTWIVKTTPTADTFTVTDLFGVDVNTTGYATYTSGGKAARIYTLTTPYAAVDLPYLKYTQSADTMSLCCVNPSTGTAYAPYDLVRSGATSWTLTAMSFATSMSAPGGVSVTANNSTTKNTYYSYVVTAVSSSTSEESVASSAGTVQNNDIAVYAGSNIISWSAVGGASGYNVYKATPSYNAAVPSGVSHGYMGRSDGTNFTDTNILADFSKVPPLHNNPFTGTSSYPSTVAYYQQRRVYANTLNQPNTYWMSQPGAYKNLDSSIPTSDTDAIIGAPWAQQVNGIQHLVAMPGGLVVLTGKGAWQVSGGGTSGNAAITPADQTAVPQAYNGCSATVPPLVVNYDILYVQSKGSVVRDLSYNFFVNIYTGTDITILSNHLFNDRQIVQWAWAEEPHKLAWLVRDDGRLLSLTFLKEQDIYSWSRHDTIGQFMGVCSVVEPPVDALYFIVKRYVNGGWRYYAERMNNRSWPTVEDCWCLDSALAYSKTYPTATLTPAAIAGTQNITSIQVIDGGSGYVSPSAVAVDPTGAGAGATFSVTVVGGVITAITPTAGGSGYSAGTYLTITDSAGSGAITQVVITNIVTFTASSSVFTSGNVGDVIRCGGGKATITSYTSGTSVKADITQEITDYLPGDPNKTPVPQVSGTWSVSTPTASVSGLNHLEGLTVSILADGSVMPDQVVTNGAVSLPQAYSSIVIGLPFPVQIQSLYLDPPGQQITLQGKRKDIYAVTIRLESSRGISVGTNQPDASTLPYGRDSIWTGMKEVKERTANVLAGDALPLYTGDVRINVPANWERRGQVAVQQVYPLPCNVLAVIPEFHVGDTPG